MIGELFTVEASVRIYNDKYGDYVYVGPDADGLDLFDIRYVEPSGKILSTLTIEPARARLVAQAILDLTEPK